MTTDDYRKAWEREREQAYPMIDAFEAECGHAMARGRLEGMARVLACPVKANPPNWQHGRVIYALTRRYLSAYDGGPVSILDIGTAKGFSALCFRSALSDHGVAGDIVSVDVLDPSARVKRNTVAEVDGFKTLYETIAPWCEPGQIDFRQQTGAKALAASSGRLHLAFVDGRHNYESVKEEARLLSERQRPGDIAIFDDTQITDVAKAVSEASGLYTLRYLNPLPQRRYAIGTRRG
jgi:predicted O-methyltransferase YrrM